jgi:RNA polymerase sigma-70 factor (ECF subfamily)
MILRRRERQSPLRDQFAAILPSSELTPDELAARSEAVQLIEAAIAQLPARCARVISLVLFDDLTNDEIAKHLGIRTGAVEKQRARARRILQRLLPPFLPW